MRLKIFTADNMQAALAKVRETLGDDAIIISSLEEKGNVSVTAAMEVPATKAKPRKALSPKPRKAPVQKSLKDLEHANHVETVDISYFLNHHGIGKTMTDRMLETAASFDDDNNINALVKTLDLMFHFSPINNDYQNRPIMLVGPPGAGKTVTAAKLTSQAVLSGRAVRLINTDIIRTGGTAQLNGYAEVLKTTVIEVSEPDLLAPAITTNRQSEELVIIDTMGYNPFDRREMTELHQFITAYNVEPIFVIAAGIDPLEAREIAQTYANLGARRFIATRLDVARRYASLLAVADENLAFAGAGITPYLAKGIERVDALSLAKLLTRVKDQEVFTPEKQDKTSPEDNDDLITDTIEGETP